MLLCELRSNPDRNPKSSILDILYRYKDRDDVYVSFTKIEKLGINPQSSYSTPLGIYAYPVKELWGEYIEHRLDSLPYATKQVPTQGVTDIPLPNMNGMAPFAGDAPYAVIFSCPEQEGFIGDFSQYTEDDLNRHIELLSSVVAPDGISKKDISLYVDVSRVQALRKTPVGRLWYIVMQIAGIIATKNRWQNRTNITDSPIPKIWNALFRKIGIVGFADIHGEGVIHANEPTQAVFFSTSPIKIIGVHDNRVRHPDLDRQRKSNSMTEYNRKKISNMVADWYEGICFGRKINYDNDAEFMARHVIGLLKIDHFGIQDGDIVRCLKGEFIKYLLKINPTLAETSMNNPRLINEPLREMLSMLISGDSDNQAHTLARWVSKLMAPDDDEYSKDYY